MMARTGSVPRTTLLLLVPGITWLTLVHHLAAGPHAGQPSLLLHLLRDVAITLPLAVTAVSFALAVGRRLTAGATPTTLEKAATAAALGFGLAVAVTAGAAVPEWLGFPAGHVASSQPAFVRLGTDLMVCLAVLVPAAFGLLLLRRPRRGTSPADIERPTDRYRGTQPRLSARVVVALIGTSAVLVGPAGVAFADGGASGGGGGSATIVPVAAGPGNPCPAGAPVKAFDVQALDVKIPLNRFGDNDPAGKMYALSSAVGDVRAEEKSQQVSIGLRDDPIQPLVIRANEGDCVTIKYANNASGGSFGMHIDGLAFASGSSGDAVGKNLGSGPATGSSTNYTFFVPNDPTMEGGHYIHPGPGYRAAVDHGLFGSLTVEPPNSQYFHAGDATKPLDSGWEAIIQPGNGRPSFREGVKLHHEVGNDNEVIRDKNGQGVPQVDDTTGSYRPGAFALNYRSEPFRNRLLSFPKEKSHSYGSYTFGDPSTPMPRGYLGDPTKFRIMNVGGEKFHVYHLHGGGDRWRMNPVADHTYDYADTGLNKNPKTQTSPSTRLDSQSIGPGESYNLEMEGGAGGVQQSVGDFLFHCHIAKHYVSGMWSFWRVYNTGQTDLAPLPDRGGPATAVDSTQLIGKSFNGTTIANTTDLDNWIRPQLPPQGTPKTGQDPTVLNWTTDPKGLVLNEPEDPTVAPDSAQVQSGHPNLLLGDQLVGNRPKMLFDPATGRLAYPMLRTHIGKRPPFTPNGHSGAPYLGETAGQAKTTPDGTVDPWANRADGLCPSGRTTRHFNVTAIALPVQRTKTTTDPEAKIFVLDKNKDAVLAGKAPADPLAIRSNIGDCDAVTLTNEMPDSQAFDNNSKTTMHIHHVQFDVQGSDGVTAGFAFEHSVRPYKVEDPQLTAAAPAGASSITVANAAKFAPGVWIAVGEGTEGIDIHQIDTISGNTLTLKTPLTNDHATGEWAGTEFIQYRWYPDVLLDNIFWHDHVDGIHGWGHGLVGQLIVEPAGSTYHDPRTGAEIDSGTIADIHTTNPLAPGIVDGSFREMALWTINDNDHADYSTLNLKAEPTTGRDPANQFSSYKYGDPLTPLPRAYPGDPIVVRTINVSPTVDTLHFQGARFLTEPRYTDANGPEATPHDALHYGVSEKYTLMLQGAGKTLKPGDYLYGNGINFRQNQGAWGIVRVLAGHTPDLQPLPDNPTPTTETTLPTTNGSNPPPTTNSFVLFNTFETSALNSHTQRRFL